MNQSPQTSPEQGPNEDPQQALQDLHSRNCYQRQLQEETSHKDVRWWHLTPHAPLQAPHIPPPCEAATWGVKLVCEKLGLSSAVQQKSTTVTASTGWGELQRHIQQLGGDVTDFWQSGEPPGKDDLVFVKLIPIRGNRDKAGSRDLAADVWHKETAKRERAALMTLSTATYGRKRACMPPIRGRDVVPRLCASLEVGGTVVLVQELVTGRTLKNIMVNSVRERWGCLPTSREATATMLGRGTLAQHVFAIEKAVKSLWMLGYIHCDLHEDNIIITPDGSARLVDLAFSYVIPTPLRSKLRCLMTPWTDVSAWYLDRGGLSLQAGMRESLSRRRVPFYNDDAKMLVKIYLMAHINEACGNNFHTMQWQRYRVWWPHGPPAAILVLSDVLLTPIEEVVHRRPRLLQLFCSLFSDV